MTKSEVSRVLSKILLEGVDVHRCAAARALGRIADPRSAGALKQALLDEDPDVRADAADALGGLAPEGDTGGCAEALMDNLLHDPDSDVKKAAIAVLVRMRHGPLSPVLRGLAVSRGDEIAWDEDEFHSDGWDSWLDIQLMAIGGLGEFGAEEAVPEIVSALDDEMGQDVSETAIGALARLGRPGAEALSALYSRGDARLRRRIADAVNARSNPHLVGLRERCLGDRSAQVRLVAAVGLARERPADPGLEPLFEDPDAKIRAAVVKHAGHGFPGLVANRFDDPDAAVRSVAFAVVAGHPDLFAADGLADTVRAAISGDPGVATQAALAWVALVGEEALGALGATLGNREIPVAFRIGVIGPLCKIGRRSVPALLAAAGDENRQLRLGILTALADFAAEDAIWPNPAGTGLLAALNGELVPEAEAAPEKIPADTREATEAAETGPSGAAPAPEGSATSTLDAILSGPAETAPPASGEEAPPEAAALSGEVLRLIELSKRRAISKKRVALESTVAPHLDVRRFAARLLGDVVRPEVTARLIAALAGEDAELHHAALQSLVQHGEKPGTLPGAARGPLLRCIGGKNADLRLLAVRAFGRLAGDSIDPTLHRLAADDDPLIRLEAVRALDARGVADDCVLACLKDGNSGVRLAAASALARHRGPAAVEPLVDFALADDGTYRREVGRLLGRFAPEPAARALLRILADESRKRTWLVAIDALGEMFPQPEAPEALKVA